MLAEIFEISLGLLARRNVGERHLHQRPILLMPGQDGELELHMDLFAVEGVIQHFPLLKDLPVPEIDELLAKMRAHVVPEDFPQATKKRRLSGA